MKRLIFVNLPVVDLGVATTFYTGLGFGLHADFSSGECSCIVVSDGIFVMLLTRDRFADFTAGPVGDLVTRALAHGGKPWLDKISDGPMYGHSFADPDGHVWEVLFMEMTA